MIKLVDLVPTTREELCSVGSFRGGVGWFWRAGGGGYTWGRRFFAALVVS